MAEDDVDAPTGGEQRQLLAIRFSGDITTKAAPTRRRFVKRMVRNLKDALKSQGVRGRVERTHNRLYIELDAAADPAPLARVFGVQSVSCVTARPWTDADDVVAAGRELFEAAVRGRSFAVRARRVGERREIPIDSQAVQRTLGAALAPAARCVDLTSPEVTVQIELTHDRAFFFTDNVRGPGGLPLGCEGHAVSLVSGGFDSPVATWQLMKRGVAVDYVFCNLGGRTHLLETLQVMKVIADQWSYGQRPHFHAIEFEDVTREIQAKITTRYWQIVLKRLMMRTAEAVAADREAVAIITGEAVGQVSSQTLQNLAVITAATPLPILRPMVGMNKEEIIDLARRVGTHDLSKSVQEYCAIVPSKPATQARLAVIEAEETRLDTSILERAIAERTVFDLRALDLDSLDLPEIQIDHVPEGATLIDLRSKAAFQSWHYPDALFLDFANALRAYRQFDGQQRYVLYCEFGLKSAHLAELMRREGIQASHFSGGLKALIDYAKTRGVDPPML
jgi:thiamine biosynthesis protein ThiI